MPLVAARYLLLLLVLMGIIPSVAGAATPTPPFAQCPAVGADTSCGLLIGINSAGQVGVYGDPTQGPYDSVEDTLIGVQNDSTHSISSIPIAATTGKPLFDFSDGDGLCTMSNAPAGCPFGPTGYEGPGVSFTQISADFTSGTVKFSPAIPPGGHTYFSLEEALATVPPFDLAPGPPNGGVTVTPNFADQANEPAVAVDPTNSKNIVVAFNSFHPDGHGNVNLRCGYESTSDGGQTWTGPTDLALPAGPSIIGSGGDPALAFTADGTLYFSCLAHDDADPRGTSRDVYAAVRAPGATKFGNSRVLVNGVSTIGPDQEHLAAAPTGNAVYMCFTFYTGISPVNGNSGVRVASLFTRATRVGLLPFAGIRSSASAGNNQRNPVGCTLSVAPSGRVWAAWWDAPFPGATRVADSHAGHAYAAYSDNGGARFTAATDLGAKRGTYNGDGKGPGAAFYPQRRVEIQASPVPGDGRVMAVWEDAPAGADNLQQAVRPTTGGAWAPATTVASNATQPALSWGADGTVLYGYYSNPNRDASRLFYGLAQTMGPAAGPLAFLQAPLGASSELFSLAPSRVPRFGDYTGVAEAGGTGWGAWTDNSGGHQTITLGQTP